MNSPCRDTRRPVGQRAENLHVRSAHRRHGRSRSVQCLAIINILIRQGLYKIVGGRLNVSLRDCLGASGRISYGPQDPSAAMQQLKTSNAMIVRYEEGPWAPERMLLCSMEPQPSHAFAGSAALWTRHQLYRQQRGPVTGR